MAASCLHISSVLGLLITLPNPLSSLKHPQGSAASHAEPCKAKNSEGHSRQPRPIREGAQHPTIEDAQRQRCPPQPPRQLYTNPAPSTPKNPCLNNVIAAI